MKRSTAVARASRLGTVKAIHRQFDQLGIRRSDLFASLSLSVPVSLGLVPCTLSTAPLDAITEPKAGGKECCFGVDGVYHAALDIV